MTIRNGMQPMTDEYREQVRQCRRDHWEHWVILQYRCNHSAFNGYRYTPSDYSTVRCRRCGRVWRTKAGYVEQLDFASMTEA